MTPCYIFDIDGTLADCTHRLHYIQQQPKDWKSFFAAVGDDAPIRHMLQLVNDLDDQEYCVNVFVSGRSDECRGATIIWLYKHLQNGKYSNVHLYMRKQGDHRPDDIVKIELLAQIRADGFEPIMAFEDRASVVDAWRKAGIPCAQVVSGDF